MPQTPLIALLDLDSDVDYPPPLQGQETFMAGFERLLEANDIEHFRVRFGGDFWERLEGVTHFVARPKGHQPDLMIMEAILPQLRAKGIKCLPDEATFYPTGDKLRLASLFAAHDIPSPHTDALFSTEEVEQWIEKVGDFPIIAKLRRGAGSRNVTLLQNADEARRLSKALFGNELREGDISKGFGLRRPKKGTGLRALARRIMGLEAPRLPVTSECLLLQEFLPNNDHDVRITVIGDRAFGFVRRTNEGDFRASGSGIIDYDPALVRKDCVDIAFDISKRFGFQTMAYDFMFDANDKPRILEMNYTYVPSAVAACGGYYERDGTYTEHDNQPPQYYQLIDLLDNEALRA